ncbi:imidazolonepropionase [Seongchinamella sediminis]|uniref:Imidazolonepropionase n=1 Tax=Seongchinamella sediminis TaxID=2283635 RepID=A0A3L7DUU0_9GAMM|nr:imidazolonepropionase [Seongchinamella sediminis]RLQ20360.1 imidazolonepropionase [Seongchinamella sediminis]
MTQQCDWLITNIRLATLLDSEQAYGAIDDGALALHGERILYAGPASALPDLAARKSLDGAGRWATPGLVDCHTHLVYGGSRATEWEQRLQGTSYEAIARAGGGILGTVKATREASEDQLYASARARLLRLLEEGVTTVEIKSGYGLEPATELKMLRVARRLGEDLPVTVRSTFLGAHALPPEYRQTGADAYIDMLLSELLPEIARLGLADAVDVFCEGVGFTPTQCERVFRAAAEHGLPVKAHVEQFSDLNGALLATRHGALSVDHLEYLKPKDVPALAAAGTVATLLPGAFYFLRETQVPPVAALREQGVPIAVATDLNPGSSPVASLLTAMNQACVLFGLTPEEALAGATRHGARALGLADRGVLAAGRRADLALWDVKHPAELSYGLNYHRPRAVFQDGALRYGR